jgi:uncharacterized membrane protein YtjA (UPF0391 family)
LVRQVRRHVGGVRLPGQDDVFPALDRLSTLEGGVPMLRWAILFLIVAIIAGVFGFGGIAAAATDIARLLFVVFLVLFVIALFLGRRSTSPPPLV